MDAANIKGENAYKLKWSGSAKSKCLLQVITNKNLTLPSPLFTIKNTKQLKHVSLLKLSSLNQCSHVLGWFSLGLIYKEQNAWSLKLHYNMALSWHACHHLLFIYNQEHMHTQNQDVSTFNFFFK